MRRDPRRLVCLGASMVFAAAGASCGSRAGAPAADVPALSPDPAPVVVPPARPTLAGARIVATATGALVIDADTGTLFAVDTGGKAIAQRAVAHDAGLLAHDPARDIAFVADRRGDRLVVIDVARMEELASWPTPAEPYGVALTPDRATVLVTTIADRTLVAFDAQSGLQRWQAALSAEPRGIAVSPDGARALVSSIATGALDHVALAPPYRVSSIPFQLHCDRCEPGDVFIRGSGSVFFLDANHAVASYQRVVPISSFSSASTRGGYGGAAIAPPVTHHAAFLSWDTGAEPTQAVSLVPNHQPRSLLWDATRDALFVAGLGTDTLLFLPRDSPSNNASLLPTEQCGPDGIAITASGDVMVWCSFTRSVMRVTGVSKRGYQPETRIVEGPSLARTTWTPEQHAGMVLFHRSSPELNVDASLSCSTCHPDGRADGLAWRIGTRSHQTPVLAGRVVDTAPYKWDGVDPTLAASLATTVKRMNGRGLSPAQVAGLIAYLEALPPPRIPTRDPVVVARGAAVFEETGCSTCHAGVRMTDRNRHLFTGAAVPVDTPSLIGVGVSAPYYHDGSAETLDDLLRGYGLGREMADLDSLSLAQRADLKAYLETR